MESKSVFFDSLSVLFEVAQSRLAVVQEGIPEEYMAESWQLSQHL